MMFDWNECLKQIGSRLNRFAHLSPDTVRGYRMLSS
jgi:hypothetical protein